FIRRLAAVRRTFGMHLCKAVQVRPLSQDSKRPIYQETKLVRLSNRFRTRILHADVRRVWQSRPCNRRLKTQLSTRANYSPRASRQSSARRWGKRSSSKIDWTPRRKSGFQRNMFEKS